jgi:hypothetical protein
MPSSAETGSGPVDGEEIRMDIAPHHQKHPQKQGPSFAKVALTGAAVVGGIVGLYLLFKHFFGKKGARQPTNGKLRRRDWKGGDLEEEIGEVYASALEDPEFLEFLEEVKASGLLDNLGEDAF